MKQLSMWLANWEKWLFRTLSLAIAIFAALNLQRFQVGEFTALFAVAFFCWLYANIARFKRFKGFGFEAELWEDKQREAEKLIDRLKSLVQLYSGELMLLKTQEGRWGGSTNNRWREIAALREQFRREHTQLSADIDLSQSDLRLKTYFVFDAVSPRLARLRRLVEEKVAEARAVIQSEFPSPISDHEAYNRRYSQLSDILPAPSGDEPFNFAKQRRLAPAVIEWFERSRVALLSHFSIGLEFPDQLRKELTAIAEIEGAEVFDLSESWLALVEGARSGV